MSHGHQPPLVRDALAYLTARGFIAVADVSGRHHKVRWTSSDGHQHALTLPKDSHGHANVASLARLRRCAGNGRSRLVKLLTASERQAEQSGVSVLLIGPTGVGKTSQVKTLESMFSRTLVVDIEAGILPIKHLPVASAPVKTMREFMDLACSLGGPNPALPPNSVFSQAHFDKVSASPELMSLAQYDVLVVDSLTALARLCFTHCEQLPEAVTDRGRKDTRAVYGIHARHMLGTLNHLQHARKRTVVFVAILERVTDDFNVVSWQPQLEGAKTGRELPGIVDEVITMNWIDFGNGKPPTRAFVCTSPNPWGFPAKDRSGRLDQLEPPDLGKLLAKLAPSATGE